MKTTAIVVDDDLDNQELFSEMLHIRDIEILARGNNGKQALELYKKYKPDIIFLDVMMPDYDGLYALKKIREYDPHSKIIMVTASLTPAIQKMLFDIKVSALILKPYEMNHLFQTIERVNQGQSKIF